MEQDNKLNLFEGKPIRKVWEVNNGFFQSLTL